MVNCRLIKSFIILCHRVYSVAIHLTGRIFFQGPAAELARMRVRRSDWTEFIYDTLYMIFSSASISARYQELCPI